MATSLFWKSWQLNNLVYDTLLRYSLPVKMIPKLEKFVTILLIILLAFLLYFNLLIEAVVFKSAELETYIILINIALAGSVALCLVLSSIIFPCAHTLFVQFFNALVESNNRLLKLSRQQSNNYIPDLSTFHLLKEGKSQLNEGSLRKLN